MGHSQKVVDRYYVNFEAILKQRFHVITDSRGAAAQSLERPFKGPGMVQLSRCGFKSRPPHKVQAKNPAAPSVRQTQM